MSGVDVGEKFGIATANLELPRRAKLCEGVYLVRVGWHERMFNGLLHFGTRKTFGSGFSVEVHIFDFSNKIYGEILLEVSLNLLSNSPIKSIKKIFSHPQPYAQSRNWLENNVPGIPLNETVSTTQAALMAKRNKYSAAIASELAGQMYSLKTIAKNIEDYPHNFTRFLVIKDSSCERTGHDKTSIVFSVKDKVGALHNILSPFDKYKINLTKIESRPSRKKAWDYIFFVDFQGHKDDKKAALCLSRVSDQCNFLKILGSYPDAKINR